MLSYTYPPFPGASDFYNCSNRGIMPQFIRPVNGSINNQIYGTLLFMNTAPINIFQDMAPLPDGAVTFYEASPTNLTVRIQINDIICAGYHR